MRTLSTRARVVVSALFLGTWGILAACSSEDENPAPNRPRTGTDSGTPGVNPSNTEGGVVGAAICAKYGGPTNVTSIATTVINTAKADCRIGPEFNLQGEEASHSNACWLTFMGNVFQCPGVVFTLGTTEGAGKKCLSYLPHITFTDLDYKAFVEDIRVTLEGSGVSADDIKSIAPAFEQIKLNLVKKNPPNKYALCAPNCARGGEACIPLIIDGGPDAKPDAPPPDTGSPPQDSGGD